MGRHGIVCLAATCGWLAACCAPAVWASDVGKRFPAETRVLVDRITGVPLTALTKPPANNSKIYQTHPQWTADGQYIIFRSNRSGGKTQAFAVHELTGDIIQLTEGNTDTGSLNVARKSNRLYFFRGAPEGPTALIELNLDPLLKDSMVGTPKEPAAYERQVAVMPAGFRVSGGFTLDADETKAYSGVSLGDEKGGLRAIDLKTGEVSKIVDVPFRMGHVQANPWVSGEIMYCHETGGDAPQRMWFVRADGTGNRPLYVETPDEWVTHETWIDADHVLFVVMAHLPRLRTKPTGIFCLNLRNNEVKVLGQVEGRGFWHCNGSADGRWAVGDTFEGSLYLIDRASGEITLLTTGHRMRPDHAHPTFSPDGKRILIQSGMLSGGTSLDLMVVNVPLWLQVRR
jgi:oligogalacturonide lyase